ncbi:MAG: hypothetical protein AABY43_00405 [Candidatus Omnitrophota bacterium]
MHGRTKRSSNCVFSIVAIGIIYFFFGPVWNITAGAAEPLPPPVNIEFTTENAPSIDTETVLKLKVTPQEDMHADISCLLPEGIEPIRKEGIIILPYDDRGQFFSDGPNQPVYTQKIELWVGPLETGIAKEFTFRVIISDKNKYELIAVVEALAKWGIKEQSLVMDIE